MWLIIIATLEGTLPFARVFVHIMPFILCKPPVIQALIKPVSEETEVHRGGSRPHGGTADLSWIHQTPKSTILCPPLYTSLLQHPVRVPVL